MMAGHGPPPKPAGMQQRKGKVSLTKLVADPDIKVPPLPNRGANPWHPQTTEWWAGIWHSPMGPEYDDSDIHGLYMLAGIVDDFWTAKYPKDRRDAAAEARLQSVRFGLSPMDRRRLQWQIEETEAKQSAGRKRRDAEAQAASEEKLPEDGEDPRNWLTEAM